MTSGLHHITLITRKVQANVDFYAGFLGLRLVKRTAGFEDATQLHLFYGDTISSPGSLITFLVWEDGSPGRAGHGAPSEVSFAIAPDAIGFWLTRALQFGIRAAGPAQEFGEPVLRLTDPDGVIVKLVGVADLDAGNPWVANGIPPESAIRSMRGATILSEQPERTAAFLALHMGFAEGPRENSQIRMTSDAGGIIDVRDAGGFWTAAPGTGTIDHIAVRAPDRAHVDAVAETLRRESNGDLNVHDRKYFYSLYVREPAGTLIELATDVPGFAIDEPVETLGTELFIPPHFARREAEVRAMLPQFGLPGEPRTIYRELPFVHRIFEPEEPDGSFVVLLHGTGGNEASLMPLGRTVAPHATFLSLRGRATEEGVARFFRRFPDGSFDQKDIASEAEAFAATIEDAGPAYGLDPVRTIFLGYSNGANFLAATMLLHPGIIRKAVLLRPMKVLDAATSASGAGRALIVTGSEDPFRPSAPVLRSQLEEAGNAVELLEIRAGHDIVPEDADVIRSWLTPERGAG